MGWQHLGDTTPIARKPHRCYLCGRQIEAGTRYVRRAGVTSDGFFASAMHEGCEAKTGGWGEEEWESHDPAEFREYELGPEGTDAEKASPGA